MANTELRLAELARSNSIRVLEDHWMDAIERADVYRDDLLEALAVLTRSGKGDEAATLGWTWLAVEKERSSSQQLLELGRELILRCGDNDEMREEILRLYEEVFADRPEISRLIDLSGIRGGRSPRRALRTLEICLGLKPGDFLVSRSDEHAAEVLAVDSETCLYTLRTPKGESVLDADSLGLAYDPVEQNDLRVLSQLRPDRIRELAESDPVALIIGVLQSHRRQIDSDQLERLLSPAFIPADKWSGWWSRARAALKRSHDVGLEGRSPVILTYSPGSHTLEDDIAPQWKRADTPAGRLAVVETYHRESKARRTPLDLKLLKRMHRDQLERVKTARKRAPAHALSEALVIERLVEALDPQQSRAVPGPGGGTVEAPARDILRESADLVALLRQLDQPVLFVRALDLVPQIRPEDWHEIYLSLLPLAPIDGCDAIAKALDEAGYSQRLQERVAQIPSDFTQHLDAVCWLWRGPSLPGLEPLPPRELLLRLLNQLGDLARSDDTPPDVLRDARLKVRAALSAGKYARYREVIEGMDAGLASTIRRTIERLEGLGQVVRATLLKIIQETHPELYVRARIDPWDDQNVILGTRAGMNKREEELNHLINVKMKENAQAIGDAAAHGDLSENSEYKFALEERDLLRARVANIQNELSLARLLTADDVQTDAVNVGTRVTLEPAEAPSADRRQMTILGPWEADIENGVYNYQAPLCHKLRGLRVGDVARMDLDGAERDWRIAGIENALAR